LTLCKKGFCRHSLNLPHKGNNIAGLVAINLHRKCPLNGGVLSIAPKGDSNARGCAQTAPGKCYMA
jgi:hypothetical protein